MVVEGRLGVAEEVEEGEGWQAEVEFQARRHPQPSVVATAVEAAAVAVVVAAAASSSSCFFSCYL